MKPGVYIEVDRDGWTGHLQLSIGERDEQGAGGGYRLGGPKFNGSGENLMRVRLDAERIAEIRRYLDKAEAMEAAGT